MTSIMTPSQMKAEQINKAVANYRAQLEKHATDFSPEAVQTVLEQSEFAGEQFAVFRRRVEDVSAFIVRRVKVNRTRSGADALKATGRKIYCSDEVVVSMQHGMDDDVEIVFFPIKRESSNTQVLERYGEFDLDPVDPFALCDYNAEDPVFDDDHPNATIWDGNCYAAFDGRDVRVGRDVDVWDDPWLFAGVRKRTPTSPPQL